ncbi:MAG: polysaccharide biosynthesis tyrosine autokinase [Anaerolineae bacterium]|nr:polysaccharide biosynthesis tyrosine autokinase [Anaerolineae bacterium]
MNDSMELNQYLAIGKKWWWLLVLGLIIGAAAGYFINQQQPSVYRATTTLMVGSSNQAPNLNNADIRTEAQIARTYASMAQRQPILQNVVDTLDLSQPWEVLRAQVTVVPVPDTQLLEITVIAGSTEEAKLIADEVANQLIILSANPAQVQKNSENRQFVEQRLDNLRAKIVAGQKRLSTLDQAMSGSLSAQKVQELQSEINELEGLIADWENNYTQLFIFFESEKPLNSLAVFEPARANAQSAAANPLRATAMGGAVGLMLALAIVFLIEYMDNTIKTADDIKQVLGLTSLGRVYQIKGNTYHDKLVTSQAPFSIIPETYRMIRSNLQFMSVDQSTKSILITSPSPEEGKSTTAANLAVVMAQAGFKTIIVDTDLRRPVQHELFQVPNNRGLTNLLCAPRFDLKPYIARTTVDNLYLLPSGPVPPNPSELLGSTRMERLVDLLSNVADVVIYDSPPVLAVADALVLSNQVDGVVLVVQAQKTRIKGAKQSIATLQQAGANLLGGIANRVTSTPPQYKYYRQEYSTNGHNGSKPLIRLDTNSTPKDHTKHNYEYNHKPV